MKILSIKATNFGSYGSLEFNFDSQGLCLISGPTGSGKSTLMDLVSWGLFGVTAKNGAADDVISWNGGVTKVVVHIDLGRIIQVVRTRGHNSNDLWFGNDNDISAPSVNRGKDLKDTQKLLDELLGIDADAYLAGAYFHEFSQTAQFFNANAKTRRQITEQFTDLSLAINLNTSLTEYRKLIKKDKEALTTDLLMYKNDTKHLALKLKEETFKQGAWETNHTDKIAKASKLLANFQRDKEEALFNIGFEHNTIALETKEEMERIKAERVTADWIAAKNEELVKRRSELTTSVCSECGAPKDNSKLLVLIKDEHDFATVLRTNGEVYNRLNRLAERLSSFTKKYERDLAKEQARENPFGAQLEALKAETNLYDPNTVQEQLNEIKQKSNNTQAAIDTMVDEFADIELLLEVVDIFRAELINNTVSQIQDRTNDLLDRHFDAELRVMFNVEGADKLEVEIYKDGNLASFTQLSKGQRHLLKLCFGVSAMRIVSHYSGVQFNAIFLDEVAEGLDETMKTKVFKLLTELSTEYDSVFAIDHSEALKSLFNNRYDVRLVNGVSQIEKT